MAQVDAGSNPVGQPDIWKEVYLQQDPATSNTGAEPQLAAGARARRFGVRDGEIVGVEVAETQRSLLFGGVLIRVSENYALEMHIDTDEANAAEVTTGMTANIVHQRA